KATNSWWMNSPRAEMFSSLQNSFMVHLGRFLDNPTMGFACGIVRTKGASIFSGYYRKGLQSFKLGDCITMVSDCRTVPMRVMALFLGIDNKTIDLFVDAHFIGGMT
ncbi:hypothetical protein VP01_11751g1, partial [Puccinia sorghi]